jgi:hypothetical protein
MFGNIISFEHLKWIGTVASKELNPSFGVENRPSFDHSKR